MNKLHHRNTSLAANKNRLIRLAFDGTKVVRLMLLGFFAVFILCNPAPVFSQDAQDGAEPEEVQDDYDAAIEDIWDPLEPMNRGIFWFNDQADIYVFEPLAEGYDTVMPDAAQKSVDNFFKNLRSPIYVVSDIIQLKFGQAATHTGRFLINTTIGVVGLFDVADSFGLPFHYEDFGVGLGYWGVGPGPYIVIPLLGPSNVRDAFGRIVDAFLNPTFYIGSVPDISNDTALVISGGLYLVDSINTRARLLEAVRSVKDASLDYYSFIQATYYQVRRNLIYDDNPPQSSSPFELSDPSSDADPLGNESGEPKEETDQEPKEEYQQEPQSNVAPLMQVSRLRYDHTKELP